MFWYKGWCSSLLLPCPGIYCFWARASYGTAAHYGAVLGDLEILIPEALADALGFKRMGDADGAVESVPRALALRGEGMCTSATGVTLRRW